MLVVEDDLDVRGQVRDVLARAGFDVVESGGGPAALRALYDSTPELVVLGLALPGPDGRQTLARIRDATDVPVLVLSAGTGELEKVRVLRAGADDYVTRPFGRHELVARVEALLRRARPRGRTRRQYADELLTIDFVARSVVADGREIRLTPLEYRILTALVEHAGATLTHPELLELCWGTARGGSAAQVRLYVNYLRRKLGGRTGGAIETVRGFGYRYRPPAAA